MSTQTQVLALLLNQTTPLSGQTIAKQLNVSRNAIWKAIEQLRLQGYEIQNIHKSGYQLIHRTTQLDIQQIIQDIDPLWEEIEVQLFDSVTSTNDLAKQFAIHSPKQTALFVATHQTQGRGRAGRPFHSSIDSGLYLSLVFPPPVSTIQETPQFTLIAACAMVDAIESLTELSIQIKWVNDLFCNGHKISGILTEATTDIESQSISSLIIGIGLNLSGDFSQAPEQTQQVAGTLFGKQLPTAFNRNQLLNVFLHRMAYYIQHIDDKAYLTQYAQHLLGIGKHVHYTQQNQQYSGIIEGINEKGHLLVRDNDGVQHTLFSQEVHFSSSQFIQ